MTTTPSEISCPFHSTVSKITINVSANRMDSSYRIHQETTVNLQRNPVKQYLPRTLPDVHTESDRFVLMTIRSHDQYNTTIYGLHDRYRGVHGNRRIVFMNALDMSERGLKTRDIVDLTSHFKGTERTSSNWIVVPYEIPQGNLAAYFPEANELVPLESTADVSNTPTSKWIEVSLSESSMHIAEEE